jgi:sulfur relay (sulfurtransferase) DsrF/TusC family protein
MMDTAPAGHRLTREAVAVVLARFEEFDPKGRQCFVINEELAVIRGVPAHRAEELAAALVSISTDSSMQAPCRSNKAGL